jgi:predicted transcriptional regulator
VIDVDNLIICELMKSTDLSHTDKSVYLSIYMLRPKSMAQAAKDSRFSRSTVAKACKNLVSTGWLRLVKRSRSKIPVPTTPERVQTLMSQRLESRFSLAKYKGEFLCKQYLTLLVSQRNYVDNARPDFLAFPMSGEPLEIDRYYPEEKVGVEFNGLQHYRPTEKYPEEEEYNKRRTRDMFKIGACSEQGVELVVITAADLSFERMKTRIPVRLQTNEVDPNDGIVRCLEGLSRQYSAQNERMRKKMSITSQTHSA